MKNIRNEILETGQQILLYFAPDWTRNTKMVATLIEKVGDNALSEYWRVNIENILITTWWISNPNKYDEARNQHQ